MKRLAGALLLVVLSAGQARAVDFEDFVGRYLGTVQIEQRTGNGSFLFQGHGTLRIRDERMVLRGEVRSGNFEVPINFEVELDEDEVDEIVAKPIFPLVVLNQSPFRWGMVGDKTWLVIRDARVTKIKGGYRLSSNGLARRDGERARGNFTLERRGEEVTLEYLFVLEDGQKLLMTVNVER